MNKFEVLEIEIEYSGAGNSGNLKVAVANDTEAGAYVETAGGNCVGKSFLNGQTCKIRIELAGKVGAGGHVDVTGSARLVLGAHVIMN